VLVLDILDMALDMVMVAQDIKMVLEMEMAM
jgi:hypothetical protein